MTFAELKQKYRIEQILAYFKIPINESGKILCPNHHETVPSAHVYAEGVYCYGCAEFFDIVSLVKLLLEQTAKVSYQDIFEWFEKTPLPEVKPIKTRSHEYKGAVPPDLIEYWFNCMDRYNQLEQERLIVKETALRYKIGWRPDTQAWVIPFYRGEPGNSEIDIVQFRNTVSEPKYIGLGGHNRGSIMNAFLLEKPQDYIVVLFHAFDPILCLQDGITAVGTNGSFPFKKDEKERVKELFKKQKNIFIVPDNNPSEHTAAYKLAEWLDAEVRFFDRELPHNLGYEDYRKLGFSALDFLQDVVGIEPITKPDPELVANIVSLLKAGDKNKFSAVHAKILGQGQVATDIARVLAKELPDMARKLWNVRTSDDLFNTLDFLATLAYNDW